ncbi:MAG: holo-ACP synthase [Oscillospiraceae bacterium]|jgi:holo-[acyl-carrier protein] synthase|nr:holo-ACP synthase [Oscillospiraceae bacterium]
MTEIARIKQSMERPCFLLCFFGERERNRLAARGNPPSSVAAAFCAKEAFSKAIGTGISGFSLREVELLSGDNGKPFLAFTGRAAAIVKEGGWRFDVSVTHTREIAAVAVVAYKEN